MSYDLSTEKISFTYQRLVQTINGSFYDGVGNLLPLGTSSVLISASTAHFATTGSNIFKGDETISGSLIFSGSIINVNSIQFNTTSVESSEVGKINWNDVDGTLDLGLKGGNVILQIGQEEVCRVVNKSGEDLLESQYHAVKIISAQGQRLAIDLAQADSDENHADTIGLITENIANNQEGYVTTNGLVREINTTGALQGETWVDGDILYLSPYTEGHLTNIKPFAPSHTIRMGYVVYSHATHGKIYVKVDIGYEIGELHDVKDTTTSSSYGDLLTKSGSLWISTKNLAGDYTVSGSLSTTNRLSTRYVVLPQVSSSLNFANDTLAGLGGVPLGGLYRNGNIIQIRLV